jgi:thiamine-monophosphate kinase
MADGVHFDSAEQSPRQIGRKALAVNLSDCAAMAVRPRWAAVSVCLPRDWTVEQARELHEGIVSLATEYDVTLVGGDTNSWASGLVIDVTIVAAPWPNVRPVQRSGMGPGDAIVVTGSLGGSRAGRHLTFEPRVREARELAERFGASLHAMMDLSDGLSTDGARMAKASGCGMDFDESALLSVASEAARNQGGGKEAAVLCAVLNDGEDFELLAAIDGEAWERDRVAYCRRIGTAVAEPGLYLKSPDATRTPIEPGGWEHSIG